LSELLKANTKNGGKGTEEDDSESDEGDKPSESVFKLPKV
jgi:hypothetical protein